MGYTIMRDNQQKNELSLENNKYNMSVEKIGDIVATTLYKNGRIVLYEETTKEIKKIKNYGDFEITKVLKKNPLNKI